MILLSTGDEDLDVVEIEENETEIRRGNLKTFQLLRT